jgi:hypothetical protein
MQQEAQLGLNITRWIVPILQAVSLVIAAIALYRTSLNYKRQTNTQVFLDCVKRYEKILESFPPKVWLERFNPGKEALEESPQTTLAVLRYLNLCSEEFYLRKQGYFSDSIAQMWERFFQRTLRTPLMMREWEHLRDEYASDEAYSAYIDEIQGKVASVNKGQK